MEPSPPVDIIELAQEVLGTTCIDETTGRLEKRMHELCQGLPLVLDSAKIAVRLSSWKNEEEKKELEMLYHYGMCEAMNYNISIMADQMGAQASSIVNLEESYKNKSVLPETRTELSLLLDDTLEVEKPGFPGDTIDMRAIASTVRLTASSTSDRWKQMAREVMDALLPREIQVLYTAASKATMYFPLPSSFIDSIAQCCAISSNLNESDMVAYMPAITSHVRSALGFRLSEVKKGKSKDINELVRGAMKLGWVPPGYDREGACEHYNIDFGTAHLKRRGPVGLKRSGVKRDKKDLFGYNGSTPVTTSDIRVARKDPNSSSHSSELPSTSLSRSSFREELDDFCDSHSQEATS